MCFSRELVKRVNAGMISGTPYNPRYASQIDLTPRQIREAFRQASIDARQQYQRDGNEHQ